jgi:hypothetical protein
LRSRAHARRHIGGRLCGESAGDGEPLGDSQPLRGRSRLAPQFDMGHLAVPVDADVCLDES